ncbi:hypothetical protein [Bacillus sp. B-jedd]|uniref:hypothetical protein n=1 Tax=Bacillus sp. B-jedd TaxID=1476857 RepID=UPI0005155BF8|nr:hypothetical protein [Bacillus sp. B-jedd]CEG26796.1 hypothetical protein BN1002_01648 [Bacillus sp. B-jedd]
MDIQQQFLKLLLPVLRQLRIKRALLWIQTGMALAGGATLAVLLAARVIVFPYYHRTALVFVTIILGMVLLFIFRRLPGIKDAAALYNNFIPEDRVISALSFYKEEGVVQKLQLAETVAHMKKEETRVLYRKNKYPLNKWLAVGLLLFAAAFLSDAYPNKTLKLAEKRETELEVLKEAKRSVAKEAGKEKNPVAKQALKELKKELAKVKTPEEALKMIEKKRNELALKELKEAEKSKELAKMSDELRKNGLDQLADAIEEKDIEKAISELAKLNKNRGSLTDSQKQALNKLSGQDSELSKEQLASLGKKLEEAMQSAGKSQQLASAQNSLNGEGKSLQEMMEAGGLPPSNIVLGPTQGNKQGQNPPGSSGQQPSGNNTSGSQPGSQPQNGAGSGTGQGNSQGAGNGTGQGSGQGSGQGTGQGMGQGNGQGTGQGGSSGGAGQGAGLGQGSRDFLTVPEKTDGKTNLETDSGKLGDGGPRQQFESDGPVLRGSIRPYEQVYNEYAAAYRQSLDRRKLPGGLENIVKNYFSDLDPDKE